MRVEDMASKRIYIMGWKGIIISILVNLAFVLGAAVGFLNYIKCLELQRAVDKGVIVQAEIVRLDHRSSFPRGSGSIYFLTYSYTDEETGIVYEGTCGSGGFDTEEEARTRIGEKVEIYIGGQGEISKQPLCWAVSYGADVEAEKALIAPCIFCSLIGLYFILLTLYISACYGKLPMFRKKKEERKEDGTEDK